MPTRLKVDNRQLPGYTSERTLVMGDEAHREAIYLGETYLGEVIYVSRKTKVGTLYGWRPAKSAAQSKLTNKVDAIKRLANYVPPND